MAEWFLETTLMLFGAALQITGILMTAQELVRASDAVGGGLVAPPFLRWLLRVPPQPQVIRASVGMVGGAVFDPTAQTTHTKPPQGDHEAWLQYLDDRVDELDRNLTELTGRLQAHKDNLRGELKRVAQEIQAVRREMAEQGRRMTLDSAKISLAGILYLLGGLAVTAFAPYIAGGVALVVGW